MKDLSLSLKKGSVFALLGHNGAGKTTTIQCLTGLIQPSNGHILVNGQVLHHHLADIQRVVGVCPQHDQIWEELTAREHLQLFADIKGVSSSLKDQQVDQRLHEVLLFDVGDKEAGKFSGGMKRRLSVAMAMMGDPQIVYLDEPTTGLDPVSRRQIWTTIQNFKKDKVVLLTTHSMYVWR